MYSPFHDSPLSSRGLPKRLASSPRTGVTRDPQAPAECRWSQQLIVQETGGFNVQLAALTAGTSPAVVAKLSGALKRAAEAPDLAEKLTAIGLIPKGGTGEEMAKIVAEDIGRFGALVKSIGIKPE